MATTNAQTEPVGSILIVGRAGGLAASAEPDLRAAGLPVHVEHGVARALARLEEVQVWVLVVEDDLTDGSGLALVRAAAARDTLLVPIVVFDDESLSEVLDVVVAGVNLRLFPCAKPASELCVQVTHRYRNRQKRERQRDDRRQYPRIHPTGMALEAPPGAVLEDIAPGGIALRTDEPHEVGERFEVSLFIRHPLPAIRLLAEVVRAEVDELGRTLVAARFPEIVPLERELILTAIRDHMRSQGPREMQRLFQESSSADITPIVAAARIEAILENARTDQLAFTVGSASGGSSWAAHVLRVEPRRGWFETRQPPASAIVAPGQRLDFLLNDESDSYLFEVSILETSAERIRCALPATIFYSEKRSKLRHSLSDTVTLHAEFEHPLESRTLSFPLLDFSSQGASFELDAAHHLFYPGTPIERLRIVLEDQVLREEPVEIRHVTPIGGQGWAKVGVRFTQAHARARAADRSPSLQLSTPGPVDSRAARSTLIKFVNSDNEEIAALANRTYRGKERFEGPVVIIPPAWGHTKEAFSAFAINLAECFERAGKPVLVLRLDFTHHRGESWIPPENRVPGRESLDFTLSHALEDVLAAIRFAYSNPMFSPTSVALFGCSFSAPVALRAARLDERVDHVICAMGTPSVQQMVTNGSGGLDYVGGRARGMQFNKVNFLGLLIDMDHAADDALAGNLAFFEDTRADVAALDCEITWIVGCDDGWVDTGQVEALLTSHRGVHEIIEVDSGHLPTHEEAVRSAVAATRAVFEHLGHDVKHVVPTSLQVLSDIQDEEWDRIPTSQVAAAGDYWRDYLLGDGEESLGFDVLAMTEAYQDFCGGQEALLDLRPGQRVLDAGAGTGNFWAQLVQRRAGAMPAEVVLVDMVAPALARAEAKLRSAPMTVHARVADLEVSRLTPVSRLVSAEYHGVECLRGRIDGLDERVLQQLIQLYRGPLASVVHQVLRGDSDLPAELAALDSDVLAVLRDLGRAARLVRGRTRIEDLTPESRAEGSLLVESGRLDALHAGHLRFEALDFRDARAPFPLPLETGGYDRVLCSLLLPYVLNPDETLAELCRSLRPGGILVASTMKPDTDMSKIQQELVEQVVRGGVDLPTGWTQERLLGELRAYTSAAAFLLRLTEEGTFRFFTAERLEALMVGAGLVAVEVRPCFGDPPQAFAARGRWTGS